MKMRVKKVIMEIYLNSFLTLEKALVKLKFRLKHNLKIKINLPNIIPANCFESRLSGISCEVSLPIL